MARNKKGSDGRYRYRIYLGKDERGAKKFKSFYGSTEKEAKAAAEEYRSAIRKGLDPDQAKDATLATLYDNLITAKKAKGIGQKSLDRYEDNRDAWGDLKDVPAGELKAADFQRVLNHLAEWHNGKPPLSHFTLSNLRSSAKAVYDLAIPEIVLYNPLVKVTVPAGAPPEPREPISEEQQRWIRETPHAAQRAAMLLLYSGLRRGEATALTWADVDLQDATITVSKGYNFAEHKSKCPKTAAGVRVVSIPKVVRSNRISSSTSNSLKVGFPSQFSGSFVSSRKHTLPRKSALVTPKIQKESLQSRTACGAYSPCRSSSWIRLLTSSQDKNACCITLDTESLRTKNS